MEVELFKPSRLVSLTSGRADKIGQVPGDSWYTKQSTVQGNGKSNLKGAYPSFAEYLPCKDRRPTTSETHL